jgi:hypothetical protein
LNSVHIYNMSKLIILASIITSGHQKTGQGDRETMLTYCVGSEETESRKAAGFG